MRAMGGGVCVGGCVNAVTGYCRGEKGGVGLLVVEKRRIAKWILVRILMGI